MIIPILSAHDPVSTLAIMTLPGGGALALMPKAWLADQSAKSKDHGKDTVRALYAHALAKNVQTVTEGSGS